jgi:hypothetical protein
MLGAGRNVNGHVAIYSAVGIPGQQMIRDDLDYSHLITPAIVLAASTDATYHTSESWLEVLMRMLAGGNPHPLNITCCPVDTINRKFDDLFVPIIEYLKCDILCEMRVHKPGGCAETQDWWSQHAEFEIICQNEDLLPPGLSLTTSSACFVPSILLFQTEKSKIRKLEKYFSTPAQPIGPEFY